MSTDEIPAETATTAQPAKVKTPPIWKPQPGPQKKFVDSKVFEVVYGGARGGGKTDAALGDFALHARKYGAGARGLLVRRTRVALEPTIARARQIFAAQEAVWHEQKSRFTWPGGARLSFRHLDHDADADAYQGHDYSRVYVEELQQSTYNSNKALIQPTVDRGNSAADALQGFLGLGGDPAKSHAAFQNYLDSTGYNFERQQGLDAVNQSAASQGLYNSGAALKALDTYGTGEAQKFGQQYIDNLGNVATRGVQGVNALTGAATNNANAQGNNNAGAANVAANAAISTGANTNALIGQALNAFGSFRGQSSYGGSSGANAFGKDGKI